MTEPSSSEDARTKIPPPPPPLPQKTAVTPKSDTFITNFLPTKGLSWANGHLELQRACYFSHVSCQDDPPMECRFKEFEGILQEGPTCGFVALSMLFNMKISAKDLLEQGLSHGFTKNGEMFSTSNFLTILRLNSDKFLPKKAQSELYEGPLDSEKIKDELKNGSILLVAYDADVNHSPALLKGHKAHWALIVGYLRTEETFYVLARHGKSKYLALWSLKALSESNSGLREFAKPKKYESQEFLLPEGGLSELREKSIVIRGVSNKDFVL